MTAEKYLVEITEWLRSYSYNRTSRFHEKMKRAADEIDRLRVEIAGKNEVIKVLHEDIRYYRKDWKDQMIQDQGRPAED